MWNHSIRIRQYQSNIIWAHQNIGFEQRLSVKNILVSSVPSSRCVHIRRIIKIAAKYGWGPLKIASDFFKQGTAGISTSSLLSDKNNMFKISGLPRQPVLLPLPPSALLWHFGSQLLQKILCLKGRNQRICCHGELSRNEAPVIHI